METACLWDYTSAVCRVIQMLLILVPVYLAEIGRAQFSNSTTSSTTAIPNVSATLTNSSETVNRTCKHRCKGSTACVSSWAEKCPNGCRYNQGRCGTTGPCVFATQFCVGNCLMIDQECADGSCVPRYSSCPGQCGPYERKCWDGSCGECSCPSYQPFKCGSQCIKQYQVCDGRRDCSDGTDEICNDNKGGNQEYSGDSGTLLMVALIAFAAFFVLIVGFVSILKKRKSGESQKTQRIDGQTPQSVVPGSGTPASRPGTRTARPATNFGSAAASVASGTQMHPVTDTESALSAETTGASTENTRVNFVMYDFQPDGTQSLADLPPSYDEVLSGKYNPPVHAEALNPCSAFAFMTEGCECGGAEIPLSRTEHAVLEGGGTSWTEMFSLEIIDCALPAEKSTDLLDSAAVPFWIDGAGTGFVLWYDNARPRRGMIAMDYHDNFEDNIQWNDQQPALT